MKKQLKSNPYTGEKTRLSPTSNDIRPTEAVSEDSSSQDSYFDKLTASKLGAEGYNLSSPSQIIQLQRTIGNRRVGEILQRVVVTAESLIADFKAKKAIPSLVRSLKTSPKPAALVHELAQIADGKAFLKAIVMQTDTSKLGQLAMQEVFGIKEVKGFDNKALKLMWPAFEQLPAKHLNSMDNDSLQGLVTYISEGDSRLNPMNSINHGDYQTKSKKARIGYSTTLVGTTLGGYEKLPGVTFLGNTRTAGMSSLERVNAFSHTVLHEVGHSIDSKLNIMSKFGGEPIFGGWENYGNSFPAKEVAQALLNEPGAPAIVASKTEMREQFNQRTRKKENMAVQVESDDMVLYRQCLNHLAEGGTIKGFVKAKIKEGKIRKNREQYYITLFRTEPTKKIKKLRELGFRTKTGWNLPYSELENLSINGRSYHRAYPASGDGPEQDNWVSYNLNSRKQAEISAYQWRAPGEWFAEVYAAYFEKALAPAHPAYGWVKQFLDNNDALNPDAIKNPTQWQQEKEQQARLAEFNLKNPPKARERAGSIPDTIVPPAVVPKPEQEPVGTGRGRSRSIS